MWAAEDKHIDATRCLTENDASVHLRDEVRWSFAELFSCL